jgi:hypothetical protein
MAMLMIDPSLADAVIPAIVFATLMLVLVVISICVAVVAVRKRAIEHDVVLRRMAHEQRMKELEIEALRLQRGASQHPAENWAAQE